MLMLHEVSPLTECSAPDGHHTVWHFAHLAGTIQSGSGLTMVEATSVTSQGLISRWYVVVVVCCFFACIVGPHPHV